MKGRCDGIAVTEADTVVLAINLLSTGSNVYKQQIQIWVLNVMTVILH